jgi:hypothetical protein
MRQPTHPFRTQRDKLLAALSLRAPEWVPLPQILELGIAQYNARILELRRQGFRIENRRDSEQKTFFRLLPAESLFDAAVRHRDLG